MLMLLAEFCATQDYDRRRLIYTPIWAKTVIWGSPSSSLFSSFLLVFHLDCRAHAPPFPGCLLCGLDHGGVISRHMQSKEPCIYHLDIILIHSVAFLMITVDSLADYNDTTQHSMEFLGDGLVQQISFLSGKELGCRVGESPALKSRYLYYSTQ